MYARTTLMWTKIWNSSEKLMRDRRRRSACRATKKINVSQPIPCESASPAKMTTHPKFLLLRFQFDKILLLLLNCLFVVCEVAHDEPVERTCFESAPSLYPPASSPTHFCSRHF